MGTAIVVDDREDVDVLGQRARHRAVAVTLVAVLLLLSGFAGASVVLNTDAARQAEQASAIDREYQELEASLVRLEELAESVVDDPGSATDRERFSQHAELTRSRVVDLRRIDADHAPELTTALERVDAYVRRTAELFELVRSDPDRAEEFEEREVDSLFEPVAELAATGSSEHMAEAAEHVGTLDRLQCVLLVATPVVFGVGLVAVGLSVAALRSSHRQTLQHARHSRHQARHDGLTGLPNRTLLAERADTAFAAAREHGTSLALLLIDLDRFKEIDDALGHRYGDLVLQTIAQRLGAGAARR